MAYFNSYQVEDRIKGKLVNGDLSTTAVTMYAQFIDPVTNVAVTPDADTLVFEVRQGATTERILADSHTTTSGITTITINAAGRAFDELTLTGGATGSQFFIGATVYQVTTGVPTNALKLIMAGTNATGGNNFRIGNDTAADDTITFNTDATTDPKIYWDDSDQRFKAHRGDDEGAAGDWELSGGMNLTTVERDALTNVINGAQIYNSTTGQIQWYEGGTWVVNAVGGTVANASTTVAGKIEMATNAELLAGTAAGATGALLVPANDDAIITEMATFFNTSDITGAEAETLTDGSDASALHVHSDFSVTSGEAFAIGAPLYIRVADGRAWMIDSSAGGEQVEAFIGFAQIAATGAAETITVSPVYDSNQAGLTAGSYYYATDAAGVISTTPGTVEKLLGLAISATEIINVAYSRRVAGTIGDIGEAETGATAVALGFRPARLLVQAKARSAVCDDGGANCLARAVRIWMEITDGQAMGMLMDRANVASGTLIDVDATTVPNLNDSATITCTEVDGAADNTITCTLAFAITDTGFTHTKDTSTTNAAQTLVEITEIRWVALG